MKLICIKCPRGCELEVNGGNISGNMCPRGIDYAREEQTNPKRIVTYLIKSKEGIIPVKTDAEVPKTMINNVLDEMSKITVSNVNIWQVVHENILGTGVNVIVTGLPYRQE